MKLHFQRFEFKYLLSFEEFREIRKYLDRYVVSDGFAKQSAGGFYEVISLYYDSPKFYYYHEKMDGVRNRKKIRLRTYMVNGSFTGRLFLEIKRKFDVVILKDRCMLDSVSYNRLMKYGSIFTPQIFLNTNETAVVQEFDVERLRRSLSPQILVRYRREPYLGRFNKNFRVTFDYDIRARESMDIFAGECDHSVLADGVVMEIKFNGRLPRYIREIIEKYNLQRVAYSKYCKAAEACYLVPGIYSSRNYFFNIDKQLAIQSYDRVI